MIMTEFLAAEKGARLNAFRVMALQVFRDTLTPSFNLQCEHICRSHCGWYSVNVKTGLENGLLFSVSR